MSLQTTVSLRWPEPAAGDNFFAGYWQPPQVGATVEFQIALPSALAHVKVQGTHWLLIGAGSGLHQGRGPVHAAAQGAGGLAFKGYLLAPALHTYSPGAALLRYWLQRMSAERSTQQHNGIFAAAVIDAQGSLTLLTDFLGMAPLYYRPLGRGLVFATNPRYLAAAGDTPDLLAWRELIQCGFLSSDRSLSTGIARLPAGHQLHADARGLRVQPWFDFDTLPAGERPIENDAAAKVEQVFQQALDRCLALSSDPWLLPLSSGHDSRRILAGLVQRNTPFEAITARVLQKGHRDLDATYAAAMARDFGFAHRIVEPPSLPQYAQDDALRQRRSDCETQAHTWSLRLFDALPARPTLLLDGILGDILGNPGFRLPDLYRSPQEDIDVILRVSVPPGFDRVLRQGAWPTEDMVREDLRAYLQHWLPRPNLAEFAFILLRQRRMTALWSQQLLPPGHVVVCPFMDLDYVRQLLDFIPAQKHAANFQRRCLEQFWPQFARYPGNRDIPNDVPPGSPQVEQQQTLTALRALRLRLRQARASERIGRLLTLRARAGFHAAAFSDALALRTAWYVNPLAELTARDAERRPCWDTASNSA